MRATVAALAVTCVVMAGCTTTTAPAATPTAAASPTYSCTNADRTSVSPCSKESYDAAEKHLALVEEAKGVYRRQYAESKRLVLAGGVTDPTPTPEIEATMADPVKENYMLTMKSINEQGIKAVSLEWKLTMREPAELFGDGAVVSLESCEDSRGSVFVDRNGASLGETVELVYYKWGFKRDGGALKMFESKAETMLTCPFV